MQFNYTDTLTLISSTLAPGTAVSLQLSFLPSYSMSTTGNPCGTTATGFSASVFASANLSGLGNTRYVDEACDLNDDLDSYSEVVVGVIGQQTTLGLSMTLTAGATRPGGSASIDALNTAEVFIDPLGDFTYVTASGNMYLTPPPQGGVPEPATLLLLGLGLAGLGVVRRRAR